MQQKVYSYCLSPQRVSFVCDLCDEANARLHCPYEINNHLSILSAGGVVSSVSVFSSFPLITNSFPLIPG